MNSSDPPDSNSPASADDPHSTEIVSFKPAIPGSQPPCDEPDMYATDNSAAVLRYPGFTHNLAVIALIIRWGVAVLAKCSKRLITICNERSLSKLRLLICLRPRIAMRFSTKPESWRHSIIRILFPSKREKGPAGVAASSTIVLNRAET